jgi:flagellar assembly protein FliH
MAMTRLVKSVQFGEHSVLLVPAREATPAKRPAVTEESPVLGQALRELQTPAIAMEAVARQVEAQPPARPSEERLKEIETAAHDKGFAEGQVAAIAEVEKEWAARLERVDQLVDALEQAKRACDTAVEEMAVAIAFESVVKIVGRKSVSLDMVRETIAELRQTEHSSEPITVRVGPEDYEALVGEPFIIELEEAQNRIRLVEDPRVAYGGCIVEATRGSQDARLETQLDRLHRILLETRRAEEG